MFYTLIIIGIILFDQITKYIVVTQMELGQRIPVIHNVFSFTSVRNTGAAWSKFENQMVLFYIISVIALIIFSYILIKEGDLINKTLYTISLLLIIGGTIGNFIDRLFRKEVVDFLEFRFINFPVFNVADVALTLGMIGFAIAVLILNE